MDGDFDLESLVHVEQSYGNIWSYLDESFFQQPFLFRRFYNAGYQDGFAHGRIHGLIEGRALGREKGFEIWEELGFYEGFALTWRAVLAKQGREEE